MSETVVSTTRSRTYPAPKIVIADACRALLAAGDEETPRTRALRQLTHQNASLTLEEAMHVHTVTASGEPAHAWTEKILRRAQEAEAKEAVATLSKISWSEDYQYLGALDPVADDIVRGIVRTSGDDLDRLTPAGEWMPVDRSVLSAYDFLELDPELLAFTASALTTGSDGVMLSFASPLLFLPVTPILASIADPLAAKDEFVYAIVDATDTSAVMDVIKLAPGPVAYVRESGKWVVNQDVLNQLLGLQPPPIVELTGELLDVVLDQVDGTAASEEMLTDSEIREDVKEETPGATPKVSDQMSYEDAAEVIDTDPTFSPRDRETPEAESLPGFTAAGQTREWDEKKYKRSALGQFAKKPKASLSTNGNISGDERRMVRQRVAGQPDNSAVARVRRLRKKRDELLAKYNDKKSPSYDPAVEYELRTGKKWKMEYYETGPPDSKGYTPDPKPGKKTTPSPAARAAEKAARRAEVAKAKVDELAKRYLADRKEFFRRERNLVTAEYERRLEADRNLRELYSRIDTAKSAQELSELQTELQTRNAEEALLRRQFYEAVSDLRAESKEREIKWRTKITKVALTASVELRPLVREAEILAMAPIVGAGGLDRNRGNAEQLRRYWVSGKGALKIRWGTEGDWRRCVKQLSKYLGVRAKGYCTLRHKEATGLWTGSKAHRAGVNTIKGLPIAASGDRVRTPEMMSEVGGNHAG